MKYQTPADHSAHFFKLGEVYLNIGGAHAE